MRMFSISLKKVFLREITVNGQINLQRSLRALEFWPRAPAYSFMVSRVTFIFKSWSSWLSTYFRVTQRVIITLKEGLLTTKRFLGSITLTMLVRI